MMHATTRLTLGAVFLAALAVGACKDSAQETADKALAVADKAQTTANTAQVKATSAQWNAALGQVTATTAQVTADVRADQANAAVVVVQRENAAYLAKVALGTAELDRRIQDLELTMKGRQREVARAALAHLRETRAEITAAVDAASQGDADRFPEHKVAIDRAIVAADAAYYNALKTIQSSKE